MIDFHFGLTLFVEYLFKIKYTNDFIKTDASPSCNKCETDEVNGSCRFDEDIRLELVGINNVWCVVRLVTDNYKISNTSLDP